MTDPVPSDQTQLKPTTDSLLSAGRYGADLTAVLAVAAFCLTFFAQGLMVRQFGVNAPFWDDWTNLALFDRLNNETLTFGDLYAQHTDHRLVVVRLLFIGLYRLFGEWSLTGQMMASAFTAALASALLAVLLLRTGRNGVTALLAALVFALPAQWENILWGFQIQFYVLILLMLSVVAILTLSRGLSAWQIGAIILLCVLSTFTMGSGMFLWGVALLCLLLREWAVAGGVRPLVTARGAWVRLGVIFAAAVVSAIAYLAGYEETFQNLKPRDVATFVRWVARSLTFPVLEQPSLWHCVAALTQWTVILLCASLLLRRARLTGDYKRLLPLAGIGAFLLVNAMVTGYRRSDYINWPGNLEVLSRYGSIFLLNLLLFLISVDDLVSLSRRARPAGAAGAVTILGVAALGLLLVHVERAISDLAHMEAIRVERVAGVGNVTAYLATDPAARQLVSPFLFPDDQGELLRQWLDTPAYVNLMPPWMSAQAAPLQATTFGDAWEVGGSYNTPSLIMQPSNWGSWGGDNARSGTLISEPIVVNRPVLAVPIAGYPAVDGNELAIEPVDGGGPRLVYSGGNPAERWDIWYADLSALQGRTVRLMAADRSATHWLGVGRPSPASGAVTALNNFVAHLDRIAAAILAGCLAFALVSLASAPKQPLASGTLAAVVVGLVLVLYIGDRAFPVTQRTEGTVEEERSFSLLAALPETFAPTPSVYPLGDGIFMHPDSALTFRPQTFGNNMCLMTHAEIDSAAPQDPLSDGVDFTVQVEASPDKPATTTTTVLPGQPVNLIVPVPADVLVTVRLQTNKRTNDSYDWAIWRELRVAPCP